jgi:phosphoglycolate phosphatase-like HAD superfamily hydrolase
MKALIFDFDWVIHDTFEFHRNKIEEYFNIVLSKWDFRDMSNWSIFDLPKKFKHIKWEWYKDYIYPEISKLKIDKNIQNTILELNKSYSLHIISSWWTNNVTEYLKNNQIHNVFGDILCYEFHKSKVFKFEHIFSKHKLNSDDCIFVTDTLWDILEANEVWIKTIAVDFWFHEKERLEKWNPYKIISSFDELFNILK